MFLFTLLRSTLAPTLLFFKNQERKETLALYSFFHECDDLIDSDKLKEQEKKFFLQELIKCFSPPENLREPPLTLIKNTKKIPESLQLKNAFYAYSDSQDWHQQSFSNVSGSCFKKSHLQEEPLTQQKKRSSPLLL